MNVRILNDADAMAQAAAADGAARIRQALAERGEARIILATGASQFGMLAALTSAGDIDWSRVTAFHLDEYLGLAATHPASFRGYLRQRFLAALPTPPRAFHELNGEGDVEAERRRVGALVAAAPIDVAFIGIGENCHLAFNAPPADFETEEPYLIVNLDEACRRQQLGEGWFPTLDDVPRQALSMSVRQIMKSRAIVCTVPDERKAAAVQQAVEGPVAPQAPASILQQHADVTIYLDPPAASRLKPGSATPA